MKNYQHWNPWHGCHKVSPGCQHCYVYELDKARGVKTPSNIVNKTSQFNYPIKRDRKHNLILPSGSTIMVCMTSDFFVEDADEWRNECWQMMKYRQDVLFLLLTKRPERVEKCLPQGWKSDGWNNIWLNVTTENQQMADKRIPILLDLPFRYKGITAAPLLEEINISKYLATDKINQVSAGGENCDDARHCNFNWFISLYNQCKEANCTFELFSLGSRFIKDGRQYKIASRFQKSQADKANINYIGKEPLINLSSTPDSEQCSFY